MGFTHWIARDYVRHRFTTLFVVLLVTIAGHGFVGDLLPIANPLDWLLGICLVPVVLSARGMNFRWFLGALAAGSIALRLAYGLLDHPVSGFLSQLLMALTCLFAASVAVRRALTSGPVNLEHISAALDAYLLVGIGFGVGYALLESAQPGSFASLPTDGMTPAHAIYFSFVVQATLGFGDIVPITERAQGLVVAQGVGGQMYLAVLVARLVSLYSDEKKHQ